MFDVMWPHSVPIMKSSLAENDRTGIKSSRYRAQKRCSREPEDALEFGMLVIALMLIVDR